MLQVGGEEVQCRIGFDSLHMQAVIMDDDDGDDLRTHMYIYTHTRMQKKLEQSNCSLAACKHCKRACNCERRIYTSFFFFTPRVIYDSSIAAQFVVVTRGWFVKLS